jgi:hypothetical protein
VLAEGHTVGTERIQMRRPDTGMPQDTERITAPLVYHNQEHVLLLAHGAFCYLLYIIPTDSCFVSAITPGCSEQYHLHKQHVPPRQTGEGN